MKKSFSLIEVIIVIVIASIILSLNPAIFYSSITNYIQSNTLLKDQLALNNTISLIQNRVNSAIKDTLQIETNRLEWVDSTKEAKEFLYTIIDLESNATTKEGFTLLNSDLTSLNKTLKDIYGNKLEKYGDYYIYLPNHTFYSTRCLNGDCTSNQLEFKDKTSKTLFEIFELTSTSIAIELVGSELFLYEDYKSFLGESRSSGIQTLLLKDVSQFTLIQSAEGISYKICTTICKEGIL